MTQIALTDPRLDWPKLYRNAEAIVGVYLARTPAAAGIRDDLLSDALLGMVTSAPRWNPDLSSAASYLGHRAWWAIIDGQRDRMPVRRHAWRQGIRVADDLPAEQQPPISSDYLHDAGYDPGALDPNLEAVVEDDKLVWLLSILPARQRDVVVRTVLGDELLHEVADDYGVTESAICQTRRRALTTLAALAEEPPVAAVSLEEYAAA